MEESRTYFAAATATGTVKTMLRVSFPPNPPPSTRELVQIHVHVLPKVDIFQEVRHAVLRILAFTYPFF